MAIAAGVGLFHRLLRQGSLNGPLASCKRPALDLNILSRSLSCSSTLLRPPTEPAIKTVPGDEHPAALPYSAIPGPKGIGQWPVLGTLMLFKPFTKYTPGTLHLLLDHLLETYGPVVKIQLRGPAVLIREIKDVETVVRNEGLMPKRHELQLQALYIERNGLRKSFNEVQGKEWSEMRNPMSRRISRVNSATYYMKEQNAVADDFREILSSGGHLTPEDLSQYFFRFAAESIGVVCFNSRLGFFDPDFSNNPDAVDFLNSTRAIFKLLHKELTGQSFMHGFYRNKTYRQYERAQLRLRYLSDQELQKAYETLKQQQKDGSFNPEEPNLLFSLLNDPKLDFDDISNVMNSLYIAGTDSTAKTLQNLFYNLAMNPDKQEILHKEIVDNIGTDQPLTPEALDKMSYLKAAVKESFRMLFPVGGLIRFIENDVILNGYHVPAGTQVIICSNSVAKSYFDNRNQYTPERWLRSEDGTRSGSYIHPLAVLPFGYGPRNCIGRRFAEQELYLATAKVLQKLKICVKPESKGMLFKYSVFLEPEKPIAFTFSER